MAYLGHYSVMHSLVTGQWIIIFTALEDLTGMKVDKGILFCRVVDFD